ncbi:hypothetical protein Asppvi_000002 [Aspergillus pseudoviridinutans]|uniref:Extradiol ring-cleavage dioxygenase class III enzyme subunit B domain-containing protein n=1 Tax=Aspergillus pseudoviridinutans TaxID=1517512 RepID=A0A9P3EQ29_9EURO|nr:uncharacterized protein Asppvi_000002 [Aspergillus pseudoviridinutans]GIJ81503.1 hypothetical protein Asppvi_000002 [Aspergillus pseudoviridinutans]
MTVKVERAPALFISHGGGPFPILNEDHEPWRQIVRSYSTMFDNTKGIIFFTAHWESSQPSISGASDPNIFFDYEDLKDQLPKAAFEIHYEGKGDADLAQRLAKRLQESGFEPVLDKARGWDHGVWIPMMLLRPSGDIPLVQMSVLQGHDEGDSTEKNILVGQALESFRNEGYAIIGSGGSSHNFDEIMKAYMSPGAKVPKGAELFEDFLQSVASISDPIERKSKLSTWRSAPGNEIAHVPGSSEHLMPFMVVSGAGGHGIGKRTDLWDLVGAPVGFYLWK